MKYFEDIEKFEKDIKEALKYQRLSDMDRDILERMRKKYIDSFVDSLFEE